MRLLLSVWATFHGFFGRLYLSASRDVLFRFWNIQQGVWSVRLDTGLATFCSLRWNAQNIRRRMWQIPSARPCRRTAVICQAPHTIRRKVNRDRSAFTFFQQNFCICNENRRYLRSRNRCHPNFNPSKPTGYVMHHQFNIQQLYALPTLYLCILYLSENKQRLLPLTA